MGMTPSDEIETRLRSMDITKFDSYASFMQAFLLEAMCNTNKEADLILFEVGLFNKAIYANLCKKALRCRFEATIPMGTNNHNKPV